MSRSNSGTPRIEPPSEIDALARLPRELAIVKMENDQMMSMAAIRPRDHAVVLADIRTQLQTYKAFAKQAMYAKPVGRDPDTGKMKYARGPSIRAAEALRCAYGFNRVSEIAEPCPEGAKLTSSFTDFATGSVWTKTGIASKTYTRRGGGQATHNDDRFWDVVVKAKQSILTREVILRSVPPGLRAELELIIDAELANFLDESTVKAMVAKFSTIDVDEKQLVKFLGRDRTAWTKADRVDLLQMWTAIEDGETTVAEAFAASQPEATPEATPEAKLESPPPSSGDAVAERVGSRSAPESVTDPVGTATKRTRNKATKPSDAAKPPAKEPEPAEPEPDEAKQPSGQPASAAADAPGASHPVTQPSNTAPVDTGDKVDMSGEPVSWDEVEALIHALTRIPPHRQCLVRVLKPLAPRDAKSIVEEMAKQIAAGTDKPGTAKAWEDWIADVAGLVEVGF